VLDSQRQGGPVLNDDARGELERHFATGRTLPSGPRELPDFRLWLIDQWKPGRSFSLMAGAVYDPVEGAFGRAHEEFDRTILPGATLWWVSADVVELVQEAAGSLPDDFAFDWSLVPDSEVLCVLEAPLMGTDSREGGPINIRVLVWGEGRLPNLMEAMGVSMYGGDDDGILWPLGRTDWVPGYTVVEPTHDDLAPHLSETQQASMAEDRRFLATLFLLAGQPNVTSAEPAPLGRAARKRSQRAGVGADVRVVDLLHRPRHHRDPATGGHHVAVRYVVRGHWRNQAWGPGRALRRPVWIHTHIRGPDGAPMKTPAEIVKALRGPPADGRGSSPGGRTG
jgi:hypothetical protein